MNNTIKNAYLEVSEGYSADRVVADIGMNDRFIRRCRELGLHQDEVELNWHLLNARKAGLLKGLRRSEPTSFHDEREYRHASEVAARFLEQREGVKLDRIICDPTLAGEFDDIAQSISPGYDSLRYRWAALNLRKSRNLKPELLSEVVLPESVRLGRVEGLDIRKIPSQQGIYIFHGSDETLYIGESSNLRTRIAKHLDHSDNKNLARWFWQNGVSDIQMEIRILPAGTTTRIRRAVEAELIQSRQPIFNVKGT